MSSTTKQSHPPIAVDDIQVCGQLVAYRRPDGRVVVRRQPCGWKACPTCGPRLRSRLAAEWSHAMGSDVVYRLVVDNDEPKRLRRLKAMAGHELAHIPLADGRRALYTTATLPGASVCEDTPLALSRDFAEMPNNDKRRYLSAGWRQVLKDAAAEAKASREPWEYLGKVGRSLGAVAIAAREAGALVGATDDMVVVEVLPLQELVFFLRRIRCRGPWEEWMRSGKRAA